MLNDFILINRVGYLLQREGRVFGRFLENGRSWEEHRNMIKLNQEWEKDYQVVLRPE